VSKEVLRAQLLNSLSQLSEDEIGSLSYSLTNQIIKFLKLNPDLTSQIGSAYLPLKAEIAPVYQMLLQSIPLALSFPVLEGTQMHFAIPDGMPRGGVWLDRPYHKVVPDWILVPGVAFDWEGARLGRGKGYYDRYLESSDALRIGLAWSEQMKEKIPVESHDCHMDFIITEKFCWDVSQQIKF
jgi:5-formyltetrahydrofolate cyclo-ligase